VRGVQLFFLTSVRQVVHTSSMTFAQWLEQTNISDAEAAKRFARDRAHISKLRRGKARPSYELMLLIAKVSKGEVGLETWAK
jgi:transcriptional regulator with XRE-family HTH domain